MPDPSPEFPIRPRRLRLDPQLRAMLQRVTLKRSDFIVPIFVREGVNIRQEVTSMPGVFQMSVDIALPWLTKRAEEGFGAYLIFGVIDKSRKDAAGSPALDENNIVCQLLRAAAKQKLPMIGITDLCFCEYTSHGHCGPMTADNSTVKNDETVALLVKQAINHARAVKAAKIIAPSGMSGRNGRGPAAAALTPRNFGGCRQHPFLRREIRQRLLWSLPRRRRLRPRLRRPPLLPNGPRPRRR